MEKGSEHGLSLPEIDDRLHVTTIAEENESANSIQVVARQGQSASQAAARTRIASSADLGPRYEFTGLQEGSAPAVACSGNESTGKGRSGLYRCDFRLGLLVKRGEIWTVAGAKDYARKPRPAVIIQDDRFDQIDSITVCAFTTEDIDAPLFRLPVQPNESTGLNSICWLMVDKITTIPKAKLGRQIGQLAPEDMVRLNRAMLVFLGIAVSTKSRSAGACVRAGFPGAKRPEPDV